jgi:hypothetical protein
LKDVQFVSGQFDIQLEMSTWAPLEGEALNSEEEG